jgi:hypothetical protein
MIITRKYTIGTGQQTLPAIPAGYYLSDIVVKTSATPTINVGVSPSLNNVLENYSIEESTVISAPTFNSDIVGSSYIVNSTATAEIFLIFIKFID